MLHGTGIFMKTDCMHMFSRHLRTRCGGTGAGIGALQVRDGDSAGDGLLRGIIAVGILLTGMVATGVAIGEVTMAVTGVVTGDLPGIITIIIPAMAGAAVIGAADMDGMVQVLTVRAFMPADITTIITHHARTVIIT